MTEKKEYIDREALIQRLAVSPLLSQMRVSCFLKEGVLDIIQKFSAADVVEVKHGEWKKIAVPFFGLNVPEAECTVCGESWTLDMRVDFEAIQNCWHYCPNCGAKMDGERKE